MCYVYIPHTHTEGAVNDIYSLYPKDFSLMSGFQTAVPSGHCIELHFSNDGCSRFLQTMRTDQLYHTECTFTMDFVT